MNQNFIYFKFKFYFKITLPWSGSPTNNFKFKNCLFGRTNIMKSIDKENYVHSGYGITFDSQGFWIFDNDTARNVIIFSVDNTSKSHSDNRKNNFMILGKGLTFGINGSFGAQKKKKKTLILISIKQT